MRSSRDGGAAAVEFALVLPLLVLVLGGVVELGYLITVRAQIGEAVEEGVLVAAREPDRADQVPDIVSNGVTIVTVAEKEVTVQCPGGRAQVAVTHEHDWVSPFLFTLSTTLDVAVVSDVLSDDPCESYP